MINRKVHLLDVHRLKSNVKTNVYHNNFKVMRIIFIILPFIVGCSSRKNNKLPYSMEWESYKIIYTVPDFFLDSMKYSSKVYFSHKIKIKNISDKMLSFDNQFYIHDSFNGKSKRLRPRFNYGRIEINQDDSISIEYISGAENFSTFFQPEKIDSSIFLKANNIVNLTYIYHVDKFHNTIKLNKSTNFYSSSENIIHSEVSNFLSGVTKNKR